MKSKVRMSFVFGLLLAGQVLVAQTVVTGNVIRVTSGDTFTLLDIRQRPYTEQDVVPPWEWRHIHPISTPEYTEPDGQAVLGADGK